jgi:hypothetical protein
LATDPSTGLLRWVSIFRAPSRNSRVLSSAGGGPREVRGSHSVEPCADGSGAMSCFGAAGAPWPPPDWSEADPAPPPLPGRGLSPATFAGEPPWSLPP